MRLFKFLLDNANVKAEALKAIDTYSMSTHIFDSLCRIIKRTLEYKVFKKTWKNKKIADWYYHKGVHINEQRLLVGLPVPYVLQKHFEGVKHCLKTYASMQKLEMSELLNYIVLKQSRLLLE